MKQYQPFILVLLAGLVLLIAQACRHADESGTRWLCCDSTSKYTTDQDTVGVAVTLPAYHNVKLIIRMRRGEAKFFRKGDTTSVYKPAGKDWEWDNGLPVDDPFNRFAKAVIWSSDVLSTAD